MRARASADGQIQFAVPSALAFVVTISVRDIQMVFCCAARPAPCSFRMLDLRCVCWGVSPNISDLMFADPIGCVHDISTTGV